MISTLIREMVISLQPYTSLRSKRFQSNSAKVGAGAKRKWKGEEEGRRGNAASGSFTPLPLPLHSFFCSRSDSRGTACYAGYPYTFTLPLLFSGGKSVHFKKARTCIERSEERYGSSFKIKVSSIQAPLVLFCFCLRRHSHDILACINDALSAKRGD